MSNRKFLKEALGMTKELKDAVKKMPDDPNYTMTTLDKIMVAQMDKLPINQLEQIRHNINRIIKRKKEFKRQNTKDA